MADDERLYRWECPVCQFDSDEAGGTLLPRGEHFCPLCASDTGKRTVLKLQEEQHDQEGA